jgi:serine/threonine-protein kinase
MGGPPEELKMTQIGRYTIVRKTGTHDGLALYEAFDPVMSRPVTIRMSDRPSRTDIQVEDTRGVVLFDASQVASLDHPNIVKILAWDSVDSRPYLVMETVSGTLLSDVLSRGFSMATDVVVSLLKNGASALDHVHSKGLLHNNLNPECMLLSEDGSLKISGFDLAQSVARLNSERATVDPDRLLVQLPYVPPEVLRGTPVGPSSDQYSLAAMAWHCLRGGVPFGNEPRIGVIQKIAFEQFPLDGLRQEVPASVVRVLERALSKEPSARFPNCREMASAFESAMRTKPFTPTRMSTSPHVEPMLPAPAPGVASPVQARSGLAPILWVAVGLILIGAISVGAWLYLKPAPPAPPPPVVEEIKKPVEPDKKAKQKPVAKKVVPKAVTPAVVKPVEKPAEKPPEEQVKPAEPKVQ